MRYEIGQEIFILCMHFNTLGYTGSPNAFIQSTALHLNEYPTAVLVRKLTITEHRKVAWQWRPDEAKYDGFVATDKYGGIWCNQMPFAEYGQVDDSADHLWRLQGTPDTETFNEGYDVLRYVPKILRYMDHLHEGNSEDQRIELIKQHLFGIESCMGLSRKVIKTGPLVIKGYALPGHYSAELLDM